ncbi:hypothetical protein PRK78_004093 [Emydomyces testavorans]|uniref:Uncharacterized protein n=1 Tax=Emydomyces testavorans TaxID=2070801 RepID=A0AAF0DKH8_9EURO|nr:hypothetical protein PRK78_004093 [Emydomyces testavorans]
MFRTSPKQLLALGVLGVCLLWGVAYLNGMFDNLDTVLETGLLLDGRVLRTVYTHNVLLDNRLKLLTAFYEALTNGLSSGPRILFFDVNYVVACTNVWVFIESRRRGVRNFFLRHAVIAIILWNANGAAIFQPPYFYFIARSKAVSRDPTIPLNEAIALFITTIPTLVAPLLLFVPAWLNYSTWDHHGFIAMFHGTPILIVIIFMVGIISLRPRHGWVSKKDVKNANVDKPWIVASYVTAGTIAAIVHLYTIISSVTTTDPDATFARLFIPSPGKTNLFPAWFPNSSPTLPALPPKYNEIMEQFHLFSQFDWIVVTLSCIVFVHYLLSRAEEDDDRKKDSRKEMSVVEMRELAYLILGTLAVGPGAAGSFALAVRESRIRERTVDKAQ